MSGDFSSNLTILHNVRMAALATDSAEQTEKDLESADAAPLLARTRASEIGRGLPQTLIETASRSLGNTPRHPDYTRYPQVPFIYEILDNADITKQIAYQWVQVRTPPSMKVVTLISHKDEGNIRRAETIVKRKRSEAQRSNPLNGYAAFRFKALPEELKKGDHIILEGMGLTRDKETVVFIALDRWHSGNGFFTEMDLGEDICMDSHAEVSWPGTGGGLGIFLSLRL